MKCDSTNNSEEEDAQIASKNEDKKNKYEITEYVSKIEEKNERSASVGIASRVNSKEDKSIKRKIKKISCPYCTSKISIKNRFCTNCGNQLNKGINDKKTNLGTMFEKFEKLKLDPELYSNVKPILFFSKYHTEPIYCVGTFAADLRPEQYHGGNKIVQALPEKSAFLLGTTADEIIDHPMLKKIPPFIDLACYQNFGRNFYHLIEDSKSLVMIRVK